MRFQAAGVAIELCRQGEETGVRPGMFDQWAASFKTEKDKDKTNRSQGLWMFYFICCCFI